jgi:hypothetical protein
MKTKFGHLRTCKDCNWFIEDIEGCSKLGYTFLRYLEMDELGQNCKEFSDLIEAGKEYVYR